MIVRNFLLTLAVVFIAVAVKNTWQFPGFKARFPNGDQVPNPCDRTLIWKGVGHESPEGAGPLNAFGVDFFGANKTWTPLLCRTDSDGDGLTNGEELGDPFCVWRVNATPTVRELAQITHPGICEPLDAPRCFGKNPFLRYCLPDLAVPRLSVCRNVTATPENAFIVRSSVPQSADGSYSPGDTIQFSCWPEFKLLGNAVIKCLDNGTWSSPVPICHQRYVIPVTLQLTFCPAPPTPRNGFVSNRSPDQIYSQYGIGETVAFSCASGYSISNRAPLQCLVDGSWSIPVPTCMPAFRFLNTSVVCGQPRIPTNAVILTQTRPLDDSRYMAGSFVMFACADGYGPSGRATITCERNATWTRAALTCTRLPTIAPPVPTCEEPVPPVNAYIFASSPRPGSSRYAIGDFVQLGCLDEFESDVRPVTICQPNGAFAPTITVMNCTRRTRPRSSSYDCAAPPIPSGINLIQVDRAKYYFDGDSIQYACPPRYFTTDPLVFKCFANGTWASSLPICREITTQKPPTDFWINRICEPPLMPRNAFVVARSVTWNGVFYAPDDWIQFACEDGYVFAGNSTLFCDREGFWSGVVYCIPMDEAQRQWYYDPQDRAYTLRPSGGFFATMRLPLAPATTTRCPRPVYPSNASIAKKQVPPNDDAATTFPVGTSFTFQCNPDYRMVGDAKIACGANGDWDSAPACVRDRGNNN